jgi:RimJ/RimL family protein N-acetyltransferase
MTLLVRFVPAEERHAESLRAAMDVVGHEGRYLGFIDARVAGMTRIELKVFTTNDRAIAFYLALGFAKGTKRRAWRLEGQYLDAHLMALLLEPE